ncbi:MAG: hypothetical protein PWQ55_55 [Chloroflexota bacterium]|nr:hypothetical protein [Chloroflexota bacterium]
MTNQSEDHQLWERIKKIVTVNLSVIFTLIIWLALFVSMLVGYFSIPLLIVVIVVSYLTLRERITKNDAEDSDKYRDAIDRDKK